MGGVGGGEAIGVGRTSTGPLRTVDIPGRNVRLAERDHAATGVEGIAEAGAWRLRGHSAKVDEGGLALALRLNGLIVGGRRDGWMGGTAGGIL